MIRVFIDDSSEYIFLFTESKDSNDIFGRINETIYDQVFDETVKVRSFSNMEAYREKWFADRSITATLRVMNKNKWFYEFATEDDYIKCMMHISTT